MNNLQGMLRSEQNVEECDPSAGSGQTATRLLNVEQKLERSVARDDEQN